MHWPDLAVLAAYFLVMIGIGVVTSRRIKRTEDYFMGGRSFGRLIQTFAAFGAGTGSSDPVNVGKTTFLDGMSGMWSVMYWLFVTPFYWITGTWYRRMRHLTLGDWFVERYQSQALGAAYTLFGLLFMIVYGSMLFSAIGKVAAPLVGFDSFVFLGRQYGIEYLLVPIIGAVVLIYGMAGGLEAAYFTDLVQGICIILLSVILIPLGLSALVDKFGDPSTQGMLHGFRILHEQIPREHFSVVGAGSTSEFPLHRIVAVVIINLAGVVIQPHFIATGGGSAKTEMSARVGLVTGNFLKRFCTIGWVLTALIALALFSDMEEIIDDPDKTWGVASRELLGGYGLSGLMLACLLAALMSSIDAYMVVGSALVVRNIYMPYINTRATEKRCLMLGRLTGIIVVGGSVIVSLFMMNVFQQLQLTWIVPLMFAPVFWVGMYWRRATTFAAWCTVTSFLLIFFVAPFVLPLALKDLRTDPTYLKTNDFIRIETTRATAPSDVAARNAAIERWDQLDRRVGDWRRSLSELSGERLEERRAELAAAEERLRRFGPRPEPLGPEVTTVTETGGKSIFWAGGVRPVEDESDLLQSDEPVESRTASGRVKTVTRRRYPPGARLEGLGNFNVEFLLYQWAGLDMSRMSNATLSTLELPPKLLGPFLLMIVVSLLTRPPDKRGVDRYYAKMKTPVRPDPPLDDAALEASYADPGALGARKLFPGSSLEFQRPTRTDVVGFVVSFVVCFLIIGLAIGMTLIGR